jgi:hypothetical protein
MTTHNWKKIASKIGPLRYQMSESDCVPTTIVNAMMFLLQRRIHPRLLSLIWHISVETKGGSGWVSSRLLSDALNIWFTDAHLDKNEKGSLPLKSKIIEGDAAHLERNNGLMRALNAGGVCCLTMHEGRHYALLLATEQDQYLLFDPWWTKAFGSSSHQEKYSAYFGLVNSTCTRDQLAETLRSENNQWCHVIAPEHTLAW